VDDEAWQLHGIGSNLQLFFIGERPLHFRLGLSPNPKGDETDILLIPRGQSA